MMMKMTTRLSIALAIGWLIAGVALAGTLDPPAPPAPTMVTQQQIWDAVKPPGCFSDDATGLRFVDCGNGTVQDMQTGLIWLKNPNCRRTSDWATAITGLAKLADGTADGDFCGLSDGSKAGMWRLPTLAEWQAIAYPYPTACDPALPAASGTGCYSTGPWAFGALSNNYWSSTTIVNIPNIPNAAWSVGLYNGGVFIQVKTNSINVWPVRGGP